MDSAENVRRLEGGEKGGLIIKKKQGIFKVPQPSLLGLDKLAAQKRQEKAEAARKMSFILEDDESTEEDDDSTDEDDESTEEDDGSSEEDDASIKQSQEKDSHKFRSPQEETPTYIGGLIKIARDRLTERVNLNKYKEIGIYASTKNKNGNEGDNYYRENRRDRERERDRSRKREHCKSSERPIKTPRFKDEPRTPNVKVKDSTSKSSWDENDGPSTSRKSAWDFPTPTAHKSRSSVWFERSGKSYDKSERSQRDYHKSSSSSKYKVEDDTPRPIPPHRYNAWMKDRKKTGATPGFGKGKEESLKWDAMVDREKWDEEQKRLDREWYNMDEGYDGEHNPFASVSEEYTKKKEEQLEQQKKKRMSAQQRQTNKDNELWERNRMLTSGAVHSVNIYEDFDEESIDRVHLLVHNMIPLFLDGRIVFTKQPEPVIPVRDSTSDMAIVARKGSHLVRMYREQKERRKAQKKHWELSGTKMGNIMEIKKKEDEDDKKFNKEVDTTDYRADHKFAEPMKDTGKFIFG